MVVAVSVGYDAVRLRLVAEEKLCPLDPKAGRKARRKLIKALRAAPGLVAVKEEAIRSVQRECARCGVCKGVGSSAIRPPR